MKFNKRKNIKKIGPIAWFLLGSIVGSAILVIWYCFSTTTLNETNAYAPWQLANYLFNIVGAIGTLLAVIVALTKEAIMKWLYSPDLQVDLVDDGISEVISNEGQRVPEASSFECYISVENIGSLAAFGCKAYISAIKYGKSKTKMKTINIQKNKQMRWLSAEVDMPVGIPSKIQLFNIVNPNNVGTPQTSDNNQKSLIVFNGCDLNNSQLHSGCWEIDYYISCKNGDVSKFVVTIDWNGDFKSRATDMKEVLTVKIEKK